MSLIGVNVVYLFLLIANYTRAVIRCDHIFRIAKLILFIVLQLMMELLTTDCHSSEQRVGAFIFLAIGAL